MFPPRLSPRELRKYGARGARLQPLGRDNMAPPESRRWRPSPLFRPLSTRDLLRGHRKRCAPSREESLLQPEKTQNFDALRVQSNPMPSAPLQQDYAQSGRASQRKVVLGPIRAYHSAPWLTTSLGP